MSSNLTLSAKTPINFIFYYINSTRRSTQVGRRGAPAKGVGRETGARVQIPPSPPRKRDNFTISKIISFSVIFAFGKLYCYAVIFGLHRVILFLAQLKCKYNINKTKQNQFCYSSLFGFYLFINSLM